MGLNVTKILIGSRLASGAITSGTEIALHINQAQLQDVLGVLVMLELEAMGIDRIKIPIAAQYADQR